MRRVEENQTVKHMMLVLFLHCFLIVEKSVFFF